MDLGTIQAQLAKLTSQLSQYGERTTMQSVPTCGVSYGQGYPTHQCSQFTANDDAWGYQGHSQSWDNMFSNAYNSDWRDYSDYMWGESQQIQQGGYWQQEEEFYHWPYEPPHPPQQSAQFNVGTSLDNDMFNKLLTSLYQEVENRNKEMPNQAKKTSELEKHVGQILEFMALIQEQKVDEELLIEEEEEDIHTARVEQPLPQPPKPSKPPTTSKDVPILFHSNVIPPNVPFPSRFLIPKQEESEKDIVEALPKVQKDIPILGATKQVLDRVEYFKGLCTPRRMIQEKVVVEEHLEFIKEEIGVDHTATTFKMPNLAENIPCAFVECAATFEPILQPIGKPPTPIPIPTSINCVLPSSLQAPTQIQFGERVYMDLRTDLYSPPYKDPMLACFEKHFVEDVLKFLLEHVGKPPTQIPNSFLTNMLLMSMIRAPTLEIQPLPEHFKYHRPFNDQLHAVGSFVRLQDVKESATWEATHAFQQRKS